MDMMLVILDLIIGIVFGFIHKGREEYTSLLRNSAICGLVVGIIFVILSVFLFPENASSLTTMFGGVFGIFVVIIVYIIIFVIGAFIGDLIEGRLKK